MQPLPVAVIGIPFLGAVLCMAVRDKAAKYVGVATSVLTRRPQSWPCRWACPERATFVRRDAVAR